MGNHKTSERTWRCCEGRRAGCLAACPRLGVRPSPRPRRRGSTTRRSSTTTRTQGTWGLSTRTTRAPACGDVMKLQIKVDDDGNIIDSCFKTFGCGSAIASSSLATEWVKGRTLGDVTEIKNADIAKHLSLPPVKLHCSMLAEDAIKAAVKDLKKKNEKQ